MARRAPVPEEQPRIVQPPQPGATRDAFLGSIAGSLFDQSNAFVWLPVDRAQRGRVPRCGGRDPVRATCT